MALEAPFPPRPGLRRAEGDCARRVRTAQQEDEAKWPRVQGVAQSGDGAAEGRGHNRRRLLDHPRLPANQLDERYR